MVPLSLQCPFSQQDLEVISTLTQFDVNSILLCLRSVFMLIYYSKKPGVISEDWPRLQDRREISPPKLFPNSSPPPTIAFQAHSAFKYSLPTHVFASSTLLCCGLRCCTSSLGEIDPTNGTGSTSFVTHVRYAQKGVSTGIF